MTTHTERLTHRCPACAGTGNDQSITAQSMARMSDQPEPCEVCTPYGPFGLVPEIVAIEQSLIGPCAAEARFRGAKRHNPVLAWLLSAGPKPS